MTTLDTVTQNMKDDLKRAKLRLRVLNLLEAELEAWDGKKMTKRLQTQFQEILGDRYHVYYDSDQTTIYLRIVSLGSKPLVDERLIILYKPMVKDNLFNFEHFAQRRYRLNCRDYVWELEAALADTDKMTAIIDTLTTFRTIVIEHNEVFKENWTITKYFDKADADLLRECRWAGRQL